MGGSPTIFATRQASRLASQPEGCPASSSPLLVWLASAASRPAIQASDPRRAANQVQPAWDVIDDFPEDIPVMPGELKVIETHLAAVLDGSLEPMSLEAEKAAIETVKPDVE